MIFKPYDNEVTKCIEDTTNHIDKVRDLLSIITSKLILRGRDHDASKLKEPELPIFVEYGPKLANCTYGSDEYKKNLKGMQVALDHHYSVCNHHPEFYDNGIRGMDLVDIMEMVCDWKAASMRHNDGDINKSLDINQKRFGYSDELKQIMKNTINNYFNEEV